MTPQVEQQLAAVQQAVSTEPVIVSYDAVNHRGVLSVARPTADGVEYLVLAEIQLVFSGPDGIQ